MTTLTADEAQTIAKDAFLFGIPLVFIGGHRSKLAATGGQEEAVAKEGS
jgi:hypothetical protein